MASSSIHWVNATPTEQAQRYKTDAAFFQKLRASVKLRYAEEIDYRDYEKQIQKMLATYVPAEEVIQVVEPVNIFEREAFRAEVERVASTRGKAEVIANRVKKTITEKMDEDPTLFKRFSEMVETAIREYEQRRLSDAEFLKRMRHVMERVRTRTVDEAVPEAVAAKPVAQAYWRNIRAVLERENHPPLADDFAAELAVSAEEIIEARRKVNWTRDQGAINQMELKIGDLVFDACAAASVPMSLDLAELVAKGVLSIAREQRP
jgi:type I restriction enzyme R subunit